MKFNKYIFRTSLILALLLLSTAYTDLFAQIELPGDGRVDDEPAASINGFIGLAMLVGSYLGIKKLKK